MFVTRDFRFWIVIIVSRYFVLRFSAYRQHRNFVRTRKRTNAHIQTVNAIAGFSAPRVHFVVRTLRTNKASVKVSLPAATGSPSLCPNIPHFGPQLLSLAFASYFHCETSAPSRPRTCVFTSIHMRHLPSPSRWYRMVYASPLQLVRL